MGTYSINCKQDSYYLDTGMGIIGSSPNVDLLYGLSLPFFFFPCPQFLMWIMRELNNSWFIFFHSSAFILFHKPEQTYFKCFNANGYARPFWLRRKFSASVTLTLVQCDMVPYLVQRNHCHVQNINQNIILNFWVVSLWDWIIASSILWGQKQIKSIQHKISTSYNITPYKKPFFFFVYE